MAAINYIKELSAFYSQPKGKISLVRLPAFNYLMIDGICSPNDNPEYSEAVAALYAVAYKLKFSVKKGFMGIDYKVMPLEGLWWADEMSQFTLENRENWLWTMMIMQPEFVTQDMVTESVEEVKQKKDPPKLEKVRFENYKEGLCMQIFHLGPYGEGERDTIAKLHDRIEEDGYRRVGKHHEIYFNSPLRTAPENLKTIIRQPVEKYP